MFIVFGVRFCIYEHILQICSYIFRKYPRSVNNFRTKDSLGFLGILEVGWPIHVGGWTEAVGELVAGCGGGMALTSEYFRVYVYVFVID